jgi:ArsR family transcriptional regulator
LNIFVNTNILAGMDKRLATLETLFKALADATRLRILGLLLDGEVCVCDIHGSLALPQPKVSRHLAYLRRAGLVDARKDGLWVHYTLARMADPVMQALLDSVGHAIGHLDAGERDRRRLATRVELPARRKLPMVASCCGR